MSLLRPLPVTHVLEAYRGAGEGLWGKERLVEALMLAQRASGEVAPRLIAFTPGALPDLMRAHGFEVAVLEPDHRRMPSRSWPALGRLVRSQPRAVVHTHGYKANIVGRLARYTGSPMLGLVSTCHAWFDESRSTRFYNALDRQSAFASDVTTVADRRMLARFPRRGRLRYVANGLPERKPPCATDRTRARIRFGFPSDALVVGFLARTNAAKGVPELMQAARRSAGERIVWAIAGSGDLAGAIEAAQLPNVRYVGFVCDSDEYRSAIDVFIQASYVEGLSLSLLEAMRAGLPIVATDAGSTTLAVRDGREATIIAPGDVSGMLRAVLAMADAEHAGRLGRAARARFEAEFRIDRQHRDFLEIYRSCAAGSA